MRTHNLPHCTFLSISSHFKNLPEQMHPHGCFCSHLYAENVHYWISNIWVSACLPDTAYMISTYFVPKKNWKKKREKRRYSFFLFPPSPQSPIALILFIALESNLSISKIQFQKKVSNKWKKNKQTHKSAPANKGWLTLSCCLWGIFLHQTYINNFIYMF